MIFVVFFLLNPFVFLLITLLNNLNDDFNDFKQLMKAMRRRRVQAVYRLHFASQMAPRDPSTQTPVQ